MTQYVTEALLDQWKKQGKLKGYREVKFLKDSRGGPDPEKDTTKAGTIVSMSGKDAAFMVASGNVEYVKPRKGDVQPNTWKSGFHSHNTQPVKTKSRANPDREILIKRLKEANLSTKRFLKVGEDKAAFELEWEKHLYGPEDLSKYPRWGICGKDGLVLCDVDKPEMIKVFREQLPETLVAVSPRRGLPHFYYKVVGGDVSNKTLFLSPTDEEGAGEIRAQNYYLVAPGTTIKYKDLKTGEQKTGTYKIVEDRPIATISFEKFMEVITPYLGKDSSQRLTREIMEQGAEKGTRHAYGIKYATRLIRYEHLDPVASLDILKRWNQKCKPPMNEKDLERMVRNAVGYAQADTPLIPSTFEEQFWESPELVRHVFSDLGRRVKRDNITKASVFFSGLSTYLSDPLNLFEKGSSGSGKTYNAIETLEYFPQEDIWYLSGMSPKALVHQRSQLLDKDGNEIYLSDRPQKPKVRDFKKDEEGYKKALKEYEQQNKIWSKRLRESYHYINIENRIFVFLEAPDPETMRMLYPILSHDKRRVEYRFVNRTATGGLRTELVVIEGFPTAIFLTTDRKYTEELATRSFTVSPEESTEKFTAANKLTNLKAALPWKCKLETPRFLAIKNLIQNIKEKLKTEDIDVIIPFLALHEPFPKDISRDMRDFSHFTQFLKSFTILHLFQRPVLIMGEKKYVIANNYDVLCCYQIFKELIESTRTGTEKRILNFYRDFIMGNVKLYVSSLTTAFNIKNKVPISDFTIRKWLNRLNEIGYVEKREDEEDKRKNIYIPLVEKPQEKPANVCDYEKKIELLSILEKGFKLWLNEYLLTNSGNVKKNVCSEDEIQSTELTDYILLDEKKALSFEESVFKYLDKPKLSQDSENKPKNICVPEKQVKANNSYFDSKPRTCPVCGGDMPLSQLSNIDGKPACKSCAKKLEISQ